MNFEIDFEFPHFSDPDFEELVENYFDSESLVQDSYDFCGGSRSLKKIKSEKLNDEKHKALKKPLSLTKLESKPRSLENGMDFSYSREGEETYFQYNSPLNQPFLNDKDDEIEDLNFDDDDDEQDFVFMKEVKKGKVKKKKKVVDEEEDLLLDHEDDIDAILMEDELGQSQFLQKQHLTYGHQFIQYTGRQSSISPVVKQQHNKGNSNQQNHQGYNYKQKKLTVSTNVSSAPNLQGFFDVSRLYITPSNKNRRGKNHIYTDSNKQHVPVIKKDKNIRFVVILPKKSNFAKTKKIKFVESFSQEMSDEGESILSPGFMYLSPLAMSHRSGKTTEWLNVCKKRWTVKKVSEPGFEDAGDNFVACCFELRFPNSQRNMQIKKNKNIYRFQLLCSMLLPDNKVQVFPVYFIYKIDSNGKKKKEIVKKLCAMRTNQNKFIYTAEKDSNTMTLEHSHLIHSYYGPSKVDGVYSLHTMDHMW